MPSILVARRYWRRRDDADADGTTAPGRPLDGAAARRSSKSSEAGLGPYTSVVIAALALLILLNRARLDAFYWRHVIGEDSAELFEMRRARQAERHVAAQRIVAWVLGPIGLLFHLSRFDPSAAVVPSVIAGVILALKPSQGRFVAYFINGFAFEMFCWKRGGDPDDAFLWSPALVLPLWNLMVIESLSTHAALEMLRLAAVLRFCASTELRLVVSALCFLIAAARVLESNHDLSLVVGCRTERRINEIVNADRKRLVGVLNHEVRNRLDILSNLIATAESGSPGSAAAARRRCSAKGAPPPS